MITATVSTPVRITATVSGKTIPPLTEPLNVTPSEQEQTYIAGGDVTGFTPVRVSAVHIPEAPQFTTAGRMFVENLVIPEGVTSIGTQGYGGVYRDSEVETVVMPNTVTTIWDMGFCNCKKLISVTFGVNLNTLRSSTFNGCTLLDNVDLSNTNIETISAACFSSCTSLTTISIPASVTSITTSNNSQATFYGCSALKNVTLGEGFACSINLSVSRQFTADDIVSMFNSLGTVTDKTFTLGATNLAKLTDAQKQIATDKGWTLA